LVATGAAACIIGAPMAVGASGPLVEVGGNLAFEYANNGRTLESRQPVALRGGYRFDGVDLFLEHDSFSYSQGTPAVQVRRSHQEWIFWGRRLFAPPGLEEIRLKPFAAGGIGARADKVETTLNGVTTTNTGRAEPLGALAGGFEAITADGFSLDVEIRATLSSGYAPNPVPGFGLFAGWRF
jgi:hypothetical protein